jgi:serine/threonine protein kinase
VPKRPLAAVIASLSARWKTATKAETMKAQRVRPPALAAGSRWRDLEIVSKLGEGGFGAVYRARDSLDRDVALKILDGDDAISEGKTLAQLHHPNIVSV